MNAGITYAQTYNLRPSVALSAEQMALLTSDIAWLVQWQVTLVDGTTQKALVPQLYAQVTEGDLTANGALLDGTDVQIDAASVLNSGTIQGRRVINLNAQTVTNLGGEIRAQNTAISTALNTVPGFNAFAILHDTWGNWLDDNGKWNTLTNLGSMPPALLINYSSLLDQNYYINPKGSK
ncbi:hypothetical protein [Curvibacter delicatus]|jgi:large exoprotein involved in heme utilization and adhesion|uniref:hypothetical protein n=1 Tax=Curvibacter delicatus TaxID=80879 RepID=UPI0008295351|nr:hypothetical protein [Curvibacter delicatus]